MLALADIFASGAPPIATLIGIVLILFLFSLDD